MSGAPSCAVCRAGELERVDRERTVEGRVFGMVRCRSCGSAFTSPLPSDELLRRFYAHSFDYRWYRDHYAVKLRDSRDRVREYAALLGRRVLDFGGGLGYFSVAAREAGHESVTFDPYVAGADPGGNWDTVVALHVIEHSSDIDATVEHIRRRLRSGGRLIAAVPNYAGLGYRTQGMDWVWAQPPLMHVFHFTAAGLTALLERHGFTDLRVSYHERWDANLYADVEHVERFRRWDAWWGSRPLNRIAPARRLLAAVNSRRRYAALARARARPPADPTELSELQVTGLLKAP